MGDIPSIVFVSPQPRQVVPSDGVVRVVVNTTEAQRLVFFAKQFGGDGIVVPRTVGRTGPGEQTTELDIPAREIPFEDAVIQLDFYPATSPTPLRFFSSRFSIR